MTITVSSDKLKKIIRETLADVMRIEFMKLRADLMPYVSDREQKEIEQKYKKPDRKVAKSVKVKL